ncbi:MAG TPA: hemerythrin domain-containing protein [Planctomycetota bacterium]|nr:hemerythrin domain-containing protein [Planctomycetota bacterium]
MNTRHPDEHRCGCGCGSTHPVEVLSQEHQTIVAVLDAMARELGSLRQGGAVRRPFWPSVLEFLEHYADRCHHAKEEHQLFVELERAGLPAAHGPTACMRSEHEMGRQLRRQMADALRAADARALADAASSFETLLREHIEKEDQVLFPLAKSMLDEAAVQRLRAGFARVEHEDIGDGAHGRFEQLARQLAREATAAAGR